MIRLSESRSTLWPGRKPTSRSTIPRASTYTSSTPWGGPRRTAKTRASSGNSSGAKNNHFVRAVFECRPAKDTWSGTSNAGKTIDFGAQIADFITIKLEGLATRIGQSAVAPFQGCLDAAQPPAAVGGAPPSGIAALPDLPLRSRSAVGDAGTTGTAAAPELVAAGGGVAAEESAEKALMARLRRGCAGVEAVEADDGSAPPALLPYPKLPEGSVQDPPGIR